MTTMTQHAPGTFCWTQLGTTDEAAAKKFYAGLFGWKDSRETAAGNPITLLKSHDKAIGAVMPLGKDQGTPSWTPFVAVTDVNVTLKRVRDAGGNVLMEPMDVNPNGKFAVFQDPTGAVFAVWQGGTKPGAEILNETGAMCWNELITTDTTKAGPFYERVFGWKPDPRPMPGQPGRTYTVFQQGPAQIAGMMAAEADMNVKQAHWLVYFAVDDCNTTAAKAAQLGATVKMQPTDIPNIGRFSVIRDPQGAWFAVLQPARK